ncbi:MAG: Penicillin-binding protein 2, peptidoglycan glycosyltransferase MrdA [Thermoanaerobacterales bacterium 50_218]|nr:MAG: Penicillin-binding protein 2, peptidoglycan glycosyltransferase MrdA [Thermoanaerobacterales bacterium 50_218]HAA90782.1 penicillin-binding protein 2 [Peptococcaceae bacterium]
MVNRHLQGKFKFFQWLLIVVFLVLEVRLATLQLLEAPVYKTKAELNQFRFLPIKAPRGEIVDCKGRVLAGNKIVNTISFFRQDVDDQELEETIQNLATLLRDFYPEIDADYIRERIEHQPRPYEPVVIKRDVPIEVVSRLEEHRSELPGVMIRKEIVRTYPEGSLASHLLGYVGEISTEELEKLQGENYRIGDLIGKSGLEARYESYLRGQDGFQQVEVDARGRPIPREDLVTVPPKQGDRLVLTLDYELQKTLEESLDKVLKEVQKENPKAKAGAAVVLDVRTGAVLAMASRPAFDPNELVPPRSASVIAKYINPPPEAESPMLNRVISSRYPPGSTFKPITGMAALEAGVIDVTEKITCKGAYWLKPHTKCWKAHGSVNFFQAMAGSCNVYFIEAGRRAGAEEMARVAQEFGLDELTGIDLPGEVKGILSSPARKKAENAPKWEKWYAEKRRELEKKYEALLAEAESTEEEQRILARKRDEERQLRALYEVKYNFYVNWQPFETYNMAIGQGSNEFTPIELVTYVATIANGGKRMRPYLVQRIEDSKGNPVVSFGPEVVHQVSVSPKTLELVKEAMVEVTAPGGTAYWLFKDFPLKVAAKTGTAESGRGKGEYHGVFVAFAPADHPEIAFAGVIEYGYHGSESAGIVARDVFAKYFGLDQEAEKQESTESSTPSGQQQVSPASTPSGGQQVSTPGTTSADQEREAQAPESPSSTQFSEPGDLQEVVVPAPEIPRQLPSEEESGQVEANLPQEGELQERDAQPPP